jgi:hypothetical protein
MGYSYIYILEIQLPYGGFHSSSCGGLQPLAAMEGPFRPKGEFLDGRTYGRTMGLRELDMHIVVF